MEVRKTGIDAIPEVPWGTHISQIYSSKEDILRVLSPYIREGLQNNELCLWIYSHNTTRDYIVEALRREIPDVDVHIIKGQLRLVPYNEWYLKGEKFDSQRTINLWLDIIDIAKKKGFDGVRVTADVGWLVKENFISFARYEEKINMMISDVPFIAVCLYDMKKLNTLELAEVIKNHGYTMMWDKVQLRLIKNLELERKTLQLQHSRQDNKKLQSLLNKTLEHDKIKMEFFSNLSHELRTPLSVILLALQLLSEQGKCKECQAFSKYQKYLKSIRQNCFRLLRLINNLIDMTRLEANYFDLSFKNCNIVEVVEDVTMSAVDCMKTKDIELSFDTDVEEKIISCDPDQIERIVLNLLSNAAKFTPAGGKVWVRVADLGDNVGIYVKDNGIGIPKGKQKAIFNSFEQVDNLFTRQHEGCGIGLPLVKFLVEKHGGKINVTSETGKGSEFAVVIPCRCPSAADHPLDISNNFKGKTYIGRADIEFSDIYVAR